ncbi:MAG: hypothetical protein WAM28_06165 [Chlamydiales bacterium]
MKISLATTTALTGAGLITLGSLGIAGVIGAHTTACSICGLSLVHLAHYMAEGRDGSFLQTVMYVALPIIAALSVYGYIPFATMAAIGIGVGVLQMISLTEIEVGGASKSIRMSFTYG